MKKPALTLGRVILTLLTVALALTVVWHLVQYYMFAPWTRDGHVRADVIQIAPDVSGLITAVAVQDNQQISRGEVLFTIDQARFELALAQAKATLAAREEAVAQAHRESRRNQALGKLVAREQLEESQSSEIRARAALAEAQVAVDRAQLDLERSVVRSPVNGFLNDRAPRAQEFVRAGQPVLSVVDSNSYHVDGYFEETKIRHIHEGQAVEIHLMGESRPLRGRVQSLSAAIEDRDRSSGSNLLPNVNPAFSWVRLAQRIPVRISLEEVPHDVRLIAGRTATVTIIEDEPTDADLQEKNP